MKVHSFLLILQQAHVLINPRLRYTATALYAARGVCVLESSSFTHYSTHYSTHSLHVHSDEDKCRGSSNANTTENTTTENPTVDSQNVTVTILLTSSGTHAYKY